MTSPGLLNKLTRFQIFAAILPVLVLLTGPGFAETAAAPRGTADLDPAWELQPTGWRVRVRGDAPLDVTLAFPIPLDDLASFTPGYTANRPVNAIPYICAAAPGILSTADLPPITPAGPGPGHDPGLVADR